ncbi:MAG: potassium/proton antiporter [Thermoanaerobaculia bacterium]
MTGEPTATAWLLLGMGLLMALSVVLSRVSARFGLPVFLLFLALGMAAGSEGIGGIEFEDYGLAFRLGTVGLTLILFDGGLNTRLARIRRALAPATILATIGVLATAGLMALGARLLGLSWPEALLVGAVVASTDAATVFSVLRGSGLHLRRRVGTTLELESGLNDPVAIVLTVALTEGLAQDRPFGLSLLWQIPLQLAIGLAIGLALGWIARILLRRIELDAGGLYAAFTVGLALLAFALPTLLFGSGFLAVYVAAIFLGAGRLPYQTGLVRFHDAAAWISQVAMFLILGLLVFPSQLGEVAWVGLGLGGLLAFVARPLAVAVCLAPFRFPASEVAYLGWVGLRGAVPIILATFPVMAGITAAERLFHLVFFIVVVNALIPGATVPWVTRWLGLKEHAPPPPRAVVEIVSHGLLEGDIVTYTIAPALAACGARVADIPFPEGTTLMLIVRDKELVAPRGGTVLRAGDHVYVFCKPRDRRLVQLLFGEEDEAGS